MKLTSTAKYLTPAAILALVLVALQGGVAGAADDAGAPRPLTDPRYPVVMDDWPVRLEARHVLFVDDEIVASRQGLHRVVEQARKHPANPVLRPEHPWEQDMVLLYGSVVRDAGDGSFRMWYLARTFDDKNPYRTVVCYAESDDGIAWRKPELGLYDYKGSRKNNIVLLNHGQGLDTIIVMVDPLEDDAAHRYKMFVYQFETPEQREGVYLYVSPDGIHWEEEPGPILVGTPIWPKNADNQFRGDVMMGGIGDVTYVGYDSELARYVANLKTMVSGQRARMIATSTDLLHWSRPRVILVPGAEDRGTQLYGMVPFPYEALWLGVVQRFRAVTDLTLDLTWAVSQDGLHWSRVEPREPFLPVGPAGAWDDGNNSPANNPPLRVGDELWFYYGGRNEVHNVRCIGAVGLATLPVDRFVALRAENTGTLLTRPLHFAAGALHLNANAESGSLRVEVLDDTGKVQPGYALTACTPISTDSVDVTVDWSGVSRIEATGAPVRLRFALERAALYAFWVE